MVTFFRNAKREFYFLIPSALIHKESEKDQVIINKGKYSKFRRQALYSCEVRILEMWISRPSSLSCLLSSRNTYTFSDKIWIIWYNSWKHEIAIYFPDNFLNSTCLTVIAPPFVTHNNPVGFPIVSFLKRCTCIIDHAKETRHNFGMKTNKMLWK